MFTFRNMSMIKHPESSYLDLIRHTLNYGKKEIRRNGGVYTHIGAALRFDLSEKTMPVMTTKKLAIGTCLKELLWFISGKTDNKLLKEQGIKIWNKNASKEFLEGRGLRYEEDDLGPVYGHQWRHFNAPYYNCKFNYSGMGVDQLNMIVDKLENDENSRRIIMSAWNPCQIKEMALPPCHLLAQFHVTSGNKLSCTMYQRSADLGLGLPFNISSYSYLTHLLAHHCGLEAEELIIFIGNCHVYDDHKEALEEQLERQPYLFPKLEIERFREKIEDYKFEDFKLLDYKHHGKINMEMRA